MDRNIHRLMSCYGMTRKEVEAFLAEQATRKAQSAAVKAQIPTYWSETLQTRVTVPHNGR